MPMQFRQVQWIHRQTENMGLDMGLDTKITWLGQIMKELGYFKGFLPILDAILNITPF